MRVIYRRPSVHALCLSLSTCPWRHPFLANSPLLSYPYPSGLARVKDRRSCDVGDPPPYLALARGALVLPGAAAVVDDTTVAARPRYRERGAVRRHLSTAGIVLAARTTVALLGHGIRAGHRWTLHLPAVYVAVLQQPGKYIKSRDDRLFVPV